MPLKITVSWGWGIFWENLTGTFKGIWCYLMSLNYFKGAASVTPIRMEGTLPLLIPPCHRMGLNPEQAFHKHSLTRLHSDHAQFGAPPKMLMRIPLVPWYSGSRKPSVLGQARATMSENTSCGDWSHHEKNRRESSESG